MYSNEKNITIQTEDRLNRGLVVGLLFDSTSDEYTGWGVVGAGDLPLGVTVGQSSGVTAGGLYNTSVQFLNGADAIKQVALAPEAEVALGALVCVGEDGMVTGVQPGAGVPIGVAMEAVDNSSDTEAKLIPVMTCGLAPFASLIPGDDDDDS